MNRFLILIFIFTIVSLGSCDQDKSSNIDMPEDALLAIMQDVHIADTILKKYRANERDSVSQILRSQIAEIHNISVEKIDFVMEQIQLSPAKYLALEKKVVDNLKSMKDSLKVTAVVKSKK